MNCENYMPLIDDLIEGEIDEQNAEQVNLHLFSCDECSAYHKALKREKEIYGHYLFDVEPPADLWATFQRKIGCKEAAANSHDSENSTTAAAPFWKQNIFRFSRFYPAACIAVVLIILGIGLFKATFDKTVSVGVNLAQKGADNVQIINDHSNETAGKEERDLSTNFESDNSFSRKKEPVKSGDKAISLNRKSKIETINKIVAVKFTKKNEGISTNSETGKILINAQPGEERLQQSQLNALESEAARQVEKTELLLRSFRNAQAADGSSSYELEYEKQQARKLLQRNARLRQTAEVFGNFYALELFDKVEPLLLDIANLEKNPAQEKVLDIKARLKNQNIIASLQVY